MTTNYPVRIERMYGAGIIRVAAKHNLREIVAEIGAAGRIDAARIKDNFTLRGPDTAAGIVQLAKSLMSAAGITKLRTGAVTGLELLITLPSRSAIDARSFFEDATRWVESHFGVPILSSVVHMDEAAPHCHVLLLPLVNGKMNGSDLHGGPAKLAAMQADFHKEVGANYGLVRHEPKKRLSAAEREAALACARRHFQSRYAMTEREIDVLLKPHTNDPITLLRGLGIAVEPVKSESKSFVDIMIAPCEPERRNPIGKAVDDPLGMVGNGIPMDGYPYTCVGKGFAKLLVISNSENHGTAGVTSTDSEQCDPRVADTFGTPQLHRINGCPEAGIVGPDSHSVTLGAPSDTPKRAASTTSRNETPTRIHAAPMCNLLTESMGTTPSTLRNGSEFVQAKVGADHPEPPPARARHDLNTWSEEVRLGMSYEGLRASRRCPPHLPEITQRGWLIHASVRHAPAVQLLNSRGGGIRDPPTTNPRF